MWLLWLLPAGPSASVTPRGRERGERKERSRGGERWGCQQPQSTSPPDQRGPDQNHTHKKRSCQQSQHGSNPQILPVVWVHTCATIRSQTDEKSNDTASNIRANKGERHDTCGKSGKLHWFIDNTRRVCKRCKISKTNQRSREIKEAEGLRT